MISQIGLDVDALNGVGIEFLDGSTPCSTSLS